MNSQPADFERSFRYEYRWSSHSRPKISIELVISQGKTNLGECF